MTFLSNIQFACLILFSSAWLGIVVQAQVPCIYDMDNYTEACSPTEFCSVSGECTLYTCENVYYHSPWQFGDLSTSPLVCEPDDTINIQSTYFSCQNFPGQGAVLNFNQKCSATFESISSTFNCFNFTDDTDFTGFTTQAGNTDLDCSNTPPPNPNDPEEVVTFPYYQYLVIIEDPAESAPIREEVNGEEKSPDFSAELALQTLYAELVSDTAPATTPPEGNEPEVPEGGVPNSDPEESGAAVVKTSLMTLVLGGLVGSLMNLYE